jgi:PIN domain nuclease of toxin-antitoxin system
LTSLVVDTHAILWYLSANESLSVRARAAMNDALQASAILVPTMSIIEITYLVEKGRIEAAYLPAVLEKLKNPGSGFLDVPMDLDIAQAMSKIPRSMVPDLPDRVISATALALGLPLVSADRRIRASGIETIW